MSTAGLLGIILASVFCFVLILILIIWIHHRIGTKRGEQVEAEYVEEMRRVRGENRRRCSRMGGSGGGSVGGGRWVSRGGSRVTGDEDGEGSKRDEGTRKDEEKEKKTPEKGNVEIRVGGGHEGHNS